MYIGIFFTPAQNIHVKMILMFVAGKHIDFCIRCVIWNLSRKVETIHPVPAKIIKNQYQIIHFHQKTAVMYKNYLHVIPISFIICVTSF